MSWTHVLAALPSRAEDLCRRFPHLDPVALTRFRGDSALLETYLAETHDLTIAEAGAALEDWAMFSFTQNRAQSAA